MVDRWAFWEVQLGAIWCLAVLEPWAESLLEWTNSEIIFLESSLSPRVLRKCCPEPFPVTHWKASCCSLQSGI